jgi:purine-binding chemotaxis protein CheW
VHESPEPAGSATARLVLEKRARALARPLRPAEAPGAAELVVMEVGSERYGVDARRVLEVRHLTKLAPVPGAPQPWAGVVSIRGTLYPVLDLRRYLSLPAEAPSGTPERAPGKVVLVQGPAFPAGLMVDEASGVQRVPAAAIGPPLVGGSDTARGAALGVTTDVLTILDVDALLSDPRLVVKETPT